MRNSCAILLALCSFWLLAAEKGEKMDIGKMDKNMAAEKAVSDGIVWHDPTQAPFRLKGLEWFAKNHEFRRLPHVEGLPPAVDNLANYTTGATIAFKTDSRRIQVDVKLLNPNMKMWNMAPLGHSGFDLYEGGPGAWKVVGVTRVFQEQSEIYTNSSEKTMREYLLNFPMYNGVKSLRIGLEEGAAIEPPTPYATTKKLVLYGGSVAQGASASRPGRGFLNIIGRHFNMEVINLGFSGSSRFEPIMAEMTAAVENPALVIVEGDRNAGWQRVRDLEPAFITTIRKKHPGVPIVVMQGNPWWGKDTSRPLIMAEQRKFMEKMQPNDPDLYWWDCTKFLGDDFGECHIDGKHPNDLGTTRMADAMIKLLTPLFQKYNVFK